MLILVFFFLLKCSFLLYFIYLGLSGYIRDLDLFDTLIYILYHWSL